MNFRYLRAVSLFFLGFLFIPFSAKAALSILVYMTGSDLESAGAAASHDLEEMSASLPEDDSIRVFVLAGGTSHWFSGIEAEETSLYQVTAAGPVKIETRPAANMGDPETLASFLNDVPGNYPSDQYALILWNHGGGPLLGVCFDERQTGKGAADSLTLNELRLALASSPFADTPLSFIGFDACMMASLEVAVCVAPYADVMIASQEPEPANGWDYRFLSTLSGCANGAEMGEKIIEAYAGSFRASLSPITLSCLDLSMTADVTEEMETLFSKLALSLSSSTYARFAHCRRNTKALGCATPSNFDLVDFVDLCEVFAEEGLCDVTRLLSLLRSFVLFSYTNEEYVNGVSIYHPFSNKNRYTAAWGGVYAGLPSPPAYRRFIQGFSNLLLGEKLVSWSGIWIPDLYKNSASVSLSMRLDPREADDFSSARLVILKETDPGSYRLLYTDNQVALHGDLLSASYGGEALYILDSAQKPLAGPVSYRVIENGIAIGAVLEEREWHPGGQKSVYLLYQYDEDGHLVFDSVYAYHDAMKLFTKSTLRLMDYDSIAFASWTRTPPEEEAAYDAWPYGQNVFIENLDLEACEFHPAFLKIPENGCYGRIEMTDLQGNFHASQLIRLPDP